MKNIPSFKEFNENYSLLESANSRIETMYYNLKKETSIDESLVFINEGIIGDSLKNWASKTLLGPLGLSKVSYIDKARKIHLALQLDLLKKKHEYENKLDGYNQEMDKLSPEVDSDKPRAEAIKKKIEEEKNVFQAYAKAQTLKIESAKDVIEEAVDGNERREAYANAGLAEDKIILADKEYDYARKSSKPKESLDALTEKIKKLKSDLEDKINAFKKTSEEKEEKGKIEDKEQQESVSDPISKKIIQRVKALKPKGIIDLVEEIKKEIATLEAEHDRVNEEMVKKRRAKKLNDTQKADYKKKLKVISAETEGRKKQLEVLLGLGKDALTISKNLKNSKTAKDVISKIADIDMEEGSNPE